MRRGYDEVPRLAVPRCTACMSPSKRECGHAKRNTGEPGFWCCVGGRHETQGAISCRANSASWGAGTAGRKEHRRGDYVSSTESQREILCGQEPDCGVS